jgi:hypothetical protein
MTERLRLLATDGQDLETISALMQDAAIRPADVAYDSRARRLIIVGSRYRWEAKGKSRVRSVLRIEGLTGLRRKNWPASGVLELLAVRSEDSAIEIDFAGGAALRADVECIDVELHDIAGPWGAASMPKHPD